MTYKFSVWEVWYDFGEPIGFRREAGPYTTREIARKVMDDMHEAYDRERLYIKEIKVYGGSEE